MTRYNFVLFHDDITSFLEQIREVGLVDITTKSWVGTPEQMSVLKQSEHIASIAKAMKSVAPVGEPYTALDEAIEAWESSSARITELDTLIAKAESEAAELAAWGVFDPQLITQLKNKGVNLKFYSIDTKLYREEWSYEYSIEKVSSTDKTTYFVIASAMSDSPCDLPANELKVPTSSINQKQTEIENFIKEQVELQSIRARAAHSSKLIEAESIRMHEEFDFDKVMTSGEYSVEGKLKIIEGWCETTDDEKVINFANSQNIVYYTEDAKIENDPPIKLKNNFFARLYEPIGSLYMLPRYDEIDLTPFFAPFFMIFFGMCFGDAAYGLLLIVAILVMWRKIPTKFRDFAWLGLFLGISTVFFGLMTGSFGGISLMEVEALVQFREYFVATENMFYVAIGMGVAQVLFGQIIRIFNRAKKGGSFVYGLSSLGWVILFVSSGIAYAKLIPEFTMESIGYYISLAVAGVLILFFNSPKKNPFINFGVGLYSFYEQGTGVVGDLISYVRLFAIGLSGGIIAQVFNSLAVGLSGDIPVLSWIIMVLILLMGHGLNIFLSMLSAFVHPIRLTFVEFFKNAEFEGGGREFNPFRRIKIDQR